MTPKSWPLNILLLLLLQSCANIVPPEGGKKDLTPPTLLSVQPEDSSLNRKISKIELRFDKYVEIKDLERNLTLSPLIRINPTVISYGKRVEIKIVDSLLQDSTTYRLSLGNAIVDNREANPYRGFNYIFSTGSYFDSLHLYGRVYDAQTGLPDSTASVFLYPQMSSDSSVFQKPPLYIQKVDGTGRFHFSVLPNRPFKAFAVKDGNNNKIYDPGEERIDFSDSLAIPSSDTAHQLKFFIFKEERVLEEDEKLDSLKDEQAGRFARSKQSPKAAMPYVVHVDTTNQDKGTFDITKNLVISHDTMSDLDASKVYLSYDDNGIEVEAISQVKPMDGKIEVATRWLENRLYTLRLVKGWAKDTTGAELPPGKYFFRTKQKADYASLKINFDSTYVNSDYVLYLFSGSDSIYQNTISEESVHLPLLAPGTYSMRLFEDENKNGIWDSGSLLEKRHAEIVISHAEAIELREGWDNEVDFKPFTEATEEAQKQDRFNKDK